MRVRFLPGDLAQAGGFAAGWAVFTAVLLLATRPMGIGPGFSRPLPYAAAAILLSGAGHLVRYWLDEWRHAAPGTPRAAGSLTRLGRDWLKGLRLFFQGPAAFNNFVFLTVAYLFGIGLTSLFIRKDSIRKGDSSRKEGGLPATGYWHDLEKGKKDPDAYYRPY